MIGGMKRIVITLFCLLSFCFMEAQEKRIIKDNFETNRFQWEEYYENKVSASIQDGFLELDCDDDDLLAWSVAELPIDVDRNFDLTFSFHADIKDDYWFGIVFNYEDGNNFNYMIVQEKRFVLFNRVNGTSNVIRRLPIILKKGKDKDIKIAMNKKGKKLIFLVDEMEVLSITKEITNNNFGCIIIGDNTIKLNEVVMEQLSAN